MAYNRSTQDGTPALECPWRPTGRDLKLPKTTQEPSPGLTLRAPGGMGDQLAGEWRRGAEGNMAALPLELA